MIGYRQLSWLVVAVAAVLPACGDGDAVDVPPGSGPVSFSVQRVFPNLPAFSQPVALIQAPGDASRWFVVEQAGRVMVFSNNATVSAATEFVNITARVAAGGETGLLGMAFHPDFPGDPRVYLSYTFSDSTLGLVSRISEFTAINGGATLDPTTEQVVMTVQQPETNHNGGGIGFGPDGFLYIGFGDGGGGDDQHGSIGNGQRQSTLLGKMLRIDIAGTNGAFRYQIPLDNPYRGNAFCGDDGTGTLNCPEIYALGFRNPWRWSFDRQTGQLWVADVGQDALEEVDRVVVGGNYGWRCFEGTRNTGMACGSLPNLLPPVAEYGRSLGQSITGGYVYRGTAVPSLVGQYVFGDFLSGKIFSIPAGTQPTMTVSSGFDSGLNISSFGEGNDGELYVVDYGGALYRVSP
ncbi:MAG TPA: PQQ-dependent sugar dehydrogenase [Burkholderiales bacterium]